MFAFLAASILVLSGSPPTTTPAGNEAFSDDFVRGNSATLGANWTVATGTMGIDSNRAEVTTLAFAENVVVYVSPTDTADQYAKFTLATVSDTNGYPGVIFRYTNSSSPMYEIFFWGPENKITWTRKANASDGAYVTVDQTGGSGTAGVATGDIFGIT
jgi:hypothetical protein